MTRAMTETVVASGHPTARLPSRLLSSIRFDEVLVLQGAPLIGASFSIGALTMDHIFAVAVLVIGSISLVAHVFVLNDWSGIHGDLADPNRAARAFTTRGTSRTEMGYLAAALLAFCLLMLGFLGPVPLGLALAIAGLSALYSAPALHMKGLPLFNSGLHLLGGAAHFLLGYATFAEVDRRGIAVSCFFALVFTAGHLMHETRDREGDLLNGIKTNAVAFGKVRSFVVGLGLFTVAYALLAALAAFGVLPHVLVFAALLYPVHLYASLRALRSGLTFDGLRQLQRCYRMLFAVIGIAMFATMSLVW